MSNPAAPYFNSNTQSVPRGLNKIFPRETILVSQPWEGGGGHRKPTNVSNYGKGEFSRNNSFLMSKFYVAQKEQNFQIFCVRQ